MKPIKSYSDMNVHCTSSIYSVYSTSIVLGEHDLVRMIWQEYSCDIMDRRYSSICHKFLKTDRRPSQER